MSDFSNIIEQYDSVEEFPPVGHPEITYRVGDWGYDYEWIQADLEGNGQYAKLNPQIRAVRDKAELPETGMADVLYIVHSGLDEREYFSWAPRAGYFHTTKEAFYEAWPCPSRVTEAQIGAYCDESMDSPSVLREYPTLNDFPDPGEPLFVYRDRSTGLEYKYQIVHNGKWGYQLRESDPSLEDCAIARAFDSKSKFPETGKVGVFYKTNDTNTLYIWDPRLIEGPLTNGVGGYTQIGNKPDAGTKARDKFQARAALTTAGRRFKRLVLWCLLIAIVVLGAGGYFLKTKWDQRIVEWRSDYHMCYAKVGNTVVEGQRKYRYKATTYLGYRFLETQVVEETTSLKYSGLPYRLVGIDSGGSWQIENKSGSRPLTELLPADTYTFISATDIKVIDYAGFCGGPKPPED